MSPLEAGAPSFSSFPGAAERHDNSVYEKITIILLLAEGKTQEEAASILGVSVKTVSRCARCYEQQGVAGLEPISKKKLRNHSHLEPEQERELKAHLQETLSPNAKAVRAYLYERYGGQVFGVGGSSVTQAVGVFV